MDRFEKEVDRVDEGPLLVFTNGASEVQTFCSISGLPPPNNEISFRHSDVDLHGKAILGSCHGWFILQSKDDDTLISLYEPRTGQSLYLPTLDAAVVKKDWDLIGTLTAPPDDSTDNNTNATPCVVYLFSNGLMFSCRPTQPDCSWVIQRVEIDGKSADIIRTVISFNGTLYGWGYPSYFFSAEIPNNENDDLDLVTLTNLQISDPKFDFEYECVTHYYIECSGRLYCILVFAVATVDKGVVGVKVSELDLPAKKWKEVNCLDGRAFFLNEIGDSTWCWGGVVNSSTSSRSIKQICVYLFSPLESDQTLYEYNMVDQSLTPICPCPDSHGKPAVWLRVSGEFWDSEKVNNNAVVVEMSESSEVLLQDCTQGKLIDELPLHLIELTAKYLHVFDYWSFRASCRMFRSAAPPTISWRTNTLFPSFLFFKNDAGLCSLMDPFRRGSRSGILQPSSEPFKIVFLSNEWLLILVGLTSLRFFNPYTKVVNGDLPSNDGLVCCRRSFVFSTNPDSDDCVTVIVYDYFDGVSFDYFRSGDKQWNNITFNHVEGITFKPTFNTPIFFQGSFWFLDVSGHLGALTLADGQQQSWSVFKKPDTGDCSKFNAPYLLEWAGKLCSVFIGDMGRGVKIFEFDDNLDKKWREIEDLGDHILFIASTSCCSRVVKDVNLRNRIYLSRLKGNGIIYYSLDTRKYHVSGKEEVSMNDLYYTKEPMKCCWIRSILHLYFRC